MIGRTVDQLAIGDTAELSRRVTHAELLPERNRARLKTTCLNPRGEEVLSGEAWVLPPKNVIHYVEERPAVTLLASWPLRPLASAARALSFWWMLGACTLCVTAPSGGELP